MSALRRGLLGLVFAALSVSAARAGRGNEVVIQGKVEGFDLNRVEISYHGKLYWIPRQWVNESDVENGKQVRIVRDKADLKWIRPGGSL